MINLANDSLFFSAFPNPSLDFLLKRNLGSFLVYCIPKKQGYYGSRTVIVHTRTLPHLQRFSCVQPTSNISLAFLVNFASGLLWQRSGHPIILIPQESKLCSGESKMSKILTNFDYCLCNHSRSKNLLMWFDLTLGPSFKVK